MGLILGLAIAAVVLVVALAAVSHALSLKRHNDARSGSNAPQCDPPPPVAWKPGQPKHCMSCGAELKFGMVEGGQERHHCSCGFIHWNNPLPVVVVVIPCKGGVVLIKRRLPPAAGSWALPGGFVNAFESPEAAAKREAKEETTLDVEIDRLLKLVMTPGKNMILMFYLAKPCNDVPKGEDDAEEARVFALSELPEMPFSTHREILQECVNLSVLS